MKKKVIKTLITATALTSMPIENPSEQTVIEEAKVEELEFEKPTTRKKRTKRQTSTTVTPPSLLELTTRVNIGEIEVNNIEHIMQRLRQINHQLISREDFLANIEFDSITTTNAVIHTTIDIPFLATPDAKHAQAIPEINFIITFTARRLTLSSVLITTDLGELSDNRPEIILSRLNELNPNLHLNFPESNTNSIRPTTFHIMPEDMNNFQAANEHIIFDHDFNITFTARRLTLSTVITNTDLGELPNNDTQTIINRLMVLNPELQRLSRGSISGYIDSRFITHNRMRWPVIEMSYWLRNQGHIIADSDINVTFTARRLTLSTVITNTDLDELPDARDETILERIVQLNPGIDINDIFRTGIGELENGEIRAGIFHTRDSYVGAAIFVYFRIAKDNNKQKDSSHVLQLSSTTTTTPSPSAGDGSAVSPSTSGQSSNTGNSSKIEINTIIKVQILIEEVKNQNVMFCKNKLLNRSY